MKSVSKAISQPSPKAKHIVVRLLLLYSILSLPLAFYYAGHSASSTYSSLKTHVNTLVQLIPNFIIVAAFILHVLAIPFLVKKKKTGWMFLLLSQLGYLYWITKIYIEGYFAPPPEARYFEIAFLYPSFFFLFMLIPLWWARDRYE